MISAPHLDETAAAIRAALDDDPLFQSGKRAEQGPYNIAAIRYRIRRICRDVQAIFVHFQRYAMQVVEIHSRKRRWLK